MVLSREDLPTWSLDRRFREGALASRRRSLDIPPIGRRQLLLTGVAAAVGATVVGPVLSPSRATASEAFLAYHGATGSEHQSWCEELLPQSYRPIALSVYDRQPRYAAVWVLRSGPEVALAHGLDAEEYQAALDDHPASGFVPVLLSVTGPRHAPTFAVAFEKLTLPFWFARHGLVDQDGSTDPNVTIEGVNQFASDNDCMPQTIAIYGSGAGDRTYAGVWLPNPERKRWRHLARDAARFEDWHQAYTQIPMRPVFVDANDGHQFSALYVDDSVGSVVSRNGLTSTAYQALFDQQTALGRVPISVQGSGVGAGVRFSAVFADRIKPIARVWTRIDDVGANVTAVHTVMEAFMTAHGVRAGVLAISEHGAHCGWPAATRGRSPIIRSPHHAPSCGWPA